MLTALRKTLKELASEEVRASHARFFKDKPQLMGLTMPTLREVAKTYRELPLDALSKLLASAFQEERILALLILIYHYKKAPDAIYAYYLDHIDFIDNWNLVDLSAPAIVGVHLLKRDKAILTKLARSKTLWHRRIAIVSTWAFIKKGELAETERLATLLLQDKEDLMHKAVGWMLREAGKKDEAFLLGFLAKHEAVMPRTMVRYAKERLSAVRNK